DGPHAGTLRNRLLPADPVRLAQLRDLVRRRGADGHGTGEPGLEAAPRRVRPAAARGRRRGGDRRLRRTAATRDRAEPLAQPGGPPRSAPRRYATAPPIARQTASATTAPAISGHGAPLEDEAGSAEGARC